MQVTSLTVFVLFFHSLNSKLCGFIFKVIVSVYSRVGCWWIEIFKTIANLIPLSKANGPSVLLLISLTETGGLVFFLHLNFLSKTLKFCSRLNPERKARSCKQLSVEYDLDQIDLSIWHRWCIAWPWVNNFLRLVFPSCKAGIMTLPDFHCKDII